MPPEAPWGGQARPDFMISSGQILCDPRAKWYQASQQFMPDVPIYNIDLPYPMFQRDQDHRDVWDYYHKYIVKQLRGLVAFVEGQTGKKMDYDRLKELVDLSDRTWNLIDEAYNLRQAVPCPMGTRRCHEYHGSPLLYDGHPDGPRFFREPQERTGGKDRQGLKGRSRRRSTDSCRGGGLPAWYALNDFNYFNSKGASFPVETTYRDGCAPWRDGSS